MLSIVEPRIVTREAPPVAGARRELLLVAGGKAPRLGGVRVELDADTESAAPIFEVPRAEPDPARDKAPPIGGVVRTSAEKPRTNIAAIAAGVSVLAHVFVLAWALHSIRPDEALAKGGDMDPIVIEGVSVVLVDQLPSPLRQAQAVEETAAAQSIEEDSPAKIAEVAPQAEPRAEIAALVPADSVQPVAEPAEPAPDVAPVASLVPDSTAKPEPQVVEAKPVEKSATSEAKGEAVEAKPVEAETRAALANDAAVPAALDPSADVPVASAEEAAVAASPADAVVKPVEPETPAQIEESEVLAKALPEDTAPATDLYRDTIADSDGAAEHAPTIEEATKPAEPPQAEVAAADASDVVAPLEDKVEPVDTPELPTKAAPPKAKKTAAVQSAPSDSREASTAEKTARGPLPGVAGAGGARDVERGKANTSSYRAQASAHLRRYRSYPDAARDLTGTAWVSFTVDARGQVMSARLSRSSGHALLDQAAVGMVKRASPFPPLPADLSDKSLAINAPVRFAR